MGPRKNWYEKKWKKKEFFLEKFAIKIVGGFIAYNMFVDFEEFKLMLYFLAYKSRLMAHLDIITVGVTPYVYVPKTSVIFSRFFFSELNLQSVGKILSA